MSEFGLVYPACINEMRFKEPIVIYRYHKMDKEMVENKAETRVQSVRDTNSKKVAFAVSRDLLVYKNKAPMFFTFVPPAVDDCRMPRKEFWGTLSSGEREEMIHEAQRVGRCLD